MPGDSNPASVAPGFAHRPEVIEYLSYVTVEKRLAQRTILLYEQDLIKLQNNANELHLPLLQLQPLHIRRMVAQMHSKGRSGRGIALILSGWCGFFQWAVLQGMVEVNPVLDIKAPKSPRPLPKALTADDAVRLAAFREEQGADQSPQTDWLETRDAAMTELLYSSGLRVAELTGLDVEGSSAGEQAGRGWIDWDAAEVHVIGKGQKRRAVPVGGPAMEALRAWRQVRTLNARTNHGSGHTPDDDLALFISRNGKRLSSQSAWLRLRQRSEKAGLNMPVHPHMLRHSFASHVLQSSGDLRAVQELLGHANIATTQVYTRLDFQHLAKIYDAAHPRAHKKSDSQEETKEQE